MMQKCIQRIALIRCMSNLNNISCIFAKKIRSAIFIWSRGYICLNAPRQLLYEQIGGKIVYKYYLYRPTCFLANKISRTPLPYRLNSMTLFISIFLRKLCVIKYRGLVKNLFQCLDNIFKWNLRNIIEIVFLHAQLNLSILLKNTWY